MKTAVVALGALVVVLACEAAPVPAKKPTVLANPAKDIFVLVPPGEKRSIPEFFRSRRIVVGAIAGKELKAAMKERKALEKVFVHYSSSNFDRQQEALYGTMLTVAPLSDECVALVEKHRVGPDGRERYSIAFVLERDAKKKSLYHAVGVVTRHHVGFFGRKDKPTADPFSPRDLRFVGSR